MITSKILFNPIIFIISPFILAYLHYNGDKFPKYSNIINVMKVVSLIYTVITIFMIGTTYINKQNSINRDLLILLSKKSVTVKNNK